ncbi:ABC transporter permease subunit [Nonomuraea thailandensis]
MGGLAGGAGARRPGRLAGVRAAGGRRAGRRPAAHARAGRAHAAAARPRRRRGRGGRGRAAGRPAGPGAHHRDRRAVLDPRVRARGGARRGVRGAARLVPADGGRRTPNLLEQPALLVLPLVVLLARPVCSISRLVRAGMVDALGSGYVAHARRLGLSPWRVRLAHALPNALAPGVQQLARTTDWLLGGVIVVESVFVIPGLGTLLNDSVSARDIPVIQALCVVFATTTVVVNLAADLGAYRLAPGSAR